MEENVVENDYDDDDEEVDDVSEDNVTIINGNHQHRSIEKCSNCDSLKQMLHLRDRTIMRLIDDRDQLKIKLTATMNENIELTRQLLRYEAILKKNNRKEMNDNNRTIDTDKQQELDFYRRRCQTLEEQNQQMKYHLYSLRNVFLELGQQQQQNNGNDDDDASYQDLSSNSNSGNVLANVVENGSQQQLPSSSLNIAISATNSINHQQQQEPKINSESSSTIKVIANQTNNEDCPFIEPILSNFDRWYNS